MSEGRTTANDVIEGLGGAAAMAWAFATPMLRDARSYWGATEEEIARRWIGDDLVPAPKWMWHHAITIDAPASEVWPWVAQIGQDKAGFYSYEALENAAGCRLHNADRVHPEWQELRAGDALRLHPEMPPMPIREVVPGRAFVAGPRVDLDTSAEVPRGAPLPERHVAVSWAFVVEPIDAGRCRLTSRYRVSYGEDLGTRARLGPTFVEPIGSTMDRRMLEGIAERVERARSRRGRDGQGGP
jgi:hypothetical protein